MTEPRFVLIEDDQDFPSNEKVCWWWDKHRSLKGISLHQPFVAMQQYVGTDPNNYVHHTELYLLFTDQVEWYIVCRKCYEANRSKQWSGSAENRNWEEESRLALRAHKSTKCWCEFCDPVFGNGGWAK